jgi:hypothetical protein
MLRYFTSHGPATVQDASWWAGLSLGDVRQGIALAGEALERRVYDDREYWCGADTRDPGAPGRRRGTRATTAHLLPNYDEYTVAYRDRRALLHPSTVPSTSAQSALLLQPVMVDGRHVGSWRRTVPARATSPVVIQVTALEPLTRPQLKALEGAADRYGSHLGRVVTLTLT